LFKSNIDLFTLQAYKETEYGVQGNKPFQMPANGLVPVSNYSEQPAKYVEGIRKKG